MSRFTQGYYKPLHPEKYRGDPSRIRYMSSWELHLHKFFDNNPNVIAWASEEIAIPYLKPTDKQVHRYFPDYWVRYKNSKGEILEELIEVKPASQTRVSRSKNTQNKLYENVQYAVNIAKWQAATEYCKKISMQTGRKLTFRIVTENSIFK